MLHTSTVDNTTVSRSEKSATCKDNWTETSASAAQEAPVGEDDLSMMFEESKDEVAVTDADIETILERPLV